MSKNILILNSYHRYLSWTDNINNTIVQKFPEYKFFVEYMDTKRFNRENIFTIFLPYLLNKYMNTKIDLIVVTDNNALDFIVKWHKLLFDKVPVVFCGVNNFKEEMLKGDEYITGVVEDVYLKETINLILKLQPDIKNIYAFMGASYTAQLYYKKFLKLKQEYKDKVNIEIINGKFFTKKELANYLKKLKNGAIFYMSFFKLIDGTIFSTFKDSLGFINKYCNLPIYTCWDIPFNFKNVVGGKITSSLKQGEYVSKFIVQILKVGVPVYSLPVLKKAPAEYIFNYKYLKKFNLSIENLPDDSKIINFPSYEKRIITKQKKYINILIILVFLLIVAIVFIFIFSIKIKKAENILNQLLEEYVNLVNSTADMVCVKDEKGRWIITNDANLKLFCLENVDYRGKTDRELAKFSPFFKDAFLQCEKSDELAWQKKDITRVEEIIPQPDGKSKIFDIIKIPIFDENGNRKRLIVIGRDITELKEMHEKIIQFQKMDLLGNLAAGIAHDFNNILASLSMNAELISIYSDNEKIKKYSENILKTIENAKNLINKIKMTARKEKKPFSVHNVIEIVNHSLSLIEPSIPANVKIVKKYSDKEEIFISCDFDEISQVIMNIILNGIDAIVMANRDEGRITIECYKEENKAIVKISDNGTGIDEEIIDKIFEPFFTTKDKFEKRGTGLGLAICKKIITDHNGRIYVKSEKNVGSEFFIEFPLIDKADKSDNRLKKEEIDTSIIEKFKNKTILLIEDEDDILNAEKELLENLGFNVICAKDGKEGLKLFKEKKDNIDIIFIDWQMPVMSGEKAIEEIRKIDKNIPIYIVTGAIDKKILDFKNNKIVTDIISKPFTLREIVKKINF